MAVCYCSLAGTAACQHCLNNPMATDVGAYKTVTVNHVETKPFGNGIDVCPVRGKPSTIGKPTTNADRIRSMTDEELAVFLDDISNGCDNWPKRRYCLFDTEEENCRDAYLKWLKEEAEE